LGLAPPILSPPYRQEHDGHNAHGDAHPLEVLGSRVLLRGRPNRFGDHLHEPLLRLFPGCFRLRFRRRPNGLGRVAGCLSDLTRDLFVHRLVVLQHHEERPDGVGGLDVQRGAGPVEALPLAVRRLAIEELFERFFEVTH